MMKRLAAACLFLALSCAAEADAPDIILTTYADLAACDQTFDC
jgi:hypothetical protein